MLTGGLYVSSAEAQYQSLQKLLEAFSALSARAPNAYLRPAGRPTSPGGARRWWQYAGTAVRKRLAAQQFNWRSFEKVLLGSRPLLSSVLTNTDQFQVIGLLHGHVLCRDTLKTI